MTALQFPAVSLTLLGARLGERAEGVSLMWLVSWDLFTWALSFTTKIACPFCQLVFFQKGTFQAVKAEIADLLIINLGSYRASLLPLSIG